MPNNPTTTTTTSTSTTGDVPTPAAPPYTVLFTHQKTKKHKTWQDGLLKIASQHTLTAGERCKVCFIHPTGDCLFHQWFHCYGYGGCSVILRLDTL